MIENICESIYEHASGYDVGHLVWCPVPHLEEVPRILDVDRASSNEHYATKFSIVQITQDHFRRKEKLPIKALSLGDTEELLISKAKKRPCIIVTGNNTTFTDPAVVDEIQGRRHLQDNSVIVAPIYGLATYEDPKGFPPIMAARIKALLYNQFFYLPMTCPKTQISLREEGIVRLDRIFAASPNRGMNPMDIKLAGEPLSVLTSMLQERFRGTPNDELKMMRELLFETLPEEARPEPSK